MSILKRYVIKSFLSTFILAMMVIMFVVTIGLLVKATQLVVKGLDPSLILQFLAYGIPELLPMTLPLAVLVSALLVFGRLSSDSEISAMRACGINIWSVMLPIAVLGLLLSALSIYINCNIAPKAYYARHLIASSASSKDALKLLEPGHLIDDFNGVSVEFVGRESENVLTNVVVYHTYSVGNDSVMRKITASRATFTVADNDLVFSFEDAYVYPGPCGYGKAKMGNCPYKIRDVFSQKAYRKKVGGFTNEDLKESILKEVDKKKQSEYRTELSRRFAYGLAPFLFVLVGMPLGIRNSRRDSNVGIMGGIIILIIYYSVMVMSKSLAKHPELFPQYIIWIPSVICLFLALSFTRKNQ